MQALAFSGNKAVARRIASSSPKAKFMGLALEGSKSFQSNLTEIHEIEVAEIARVPRHAGRR